MAEILLFPGAILRLSTSSSVTTPESASRVPCLGDRRIVLFPIVTESPTGSNVFQPDDTLNLPGLDAQREEEGDSG